uniref:Uncharacterized protein n=1 Tax=viral metagenome TaxID=1070528 RepID=A0A6M3JBV9_9ZZZZ
MSKKPDGQFDMTMMKQVQDHATDLVTRHGARNEMFEYQLRMYLLDWEEKAAIEKKMEGAKLTISPDVRNRIIGAVRLLVATDPVWSVPELLNVQAVLDNGDAMELLAKRLWLAASNVVQNPPLFEIVLSMVLFAECHIGITRTADLVEQAKGASKAAEYRAEEIARSTPIIFDVWDPRDGYPELDNMGTQAYYREVKTTSGSVMDEFGDDAKVLYPDGDRYKMVVLCNYMDHIYRHVWTQGTERPIRQEKHDLPFLPVTVQLGEGSMLFSEPENQRQPMGYGLWKSGMWARQNLAWTVAYSNLYAVGANAMFEEQLNAQGQGVTHSKNRPGGVITVPQGAGWKMMDQSMVVNPALIQMMSLADQKVGESTIYAQTLGEPLGGNAPFSMVALLHQAGRLPLMVPQRKAARALAKVMKKALVWLKKEPSEYDYEHIMGEMKAADIPEHFELEATLKIDLPQDDLQNTKVATMAATGEDPLVSKRWAREKTLSIGQSDKMQEEIWGERASGMKFQQYVMEQMLRLQEMQARLEQGAQGMPPKGMPPQQRQPLPQQGMPMTPEGMPMEEPMPEGLPMQGPVMPGQEPGMAGEPGSMGAGGMLE